MTTKLIDMNVGIQLTLLVDGKEQVVRWSAVCPSESFNHPSEIIQAICNQVNYTFGTNYHVQKHERYPKKEIQIARPKRIKAHRAVSQEEFVKKIKELGY